jgi:hypothetical protein
MGDGSALCATLPAASEGIKRITIDNPRVQRMTADGGVAGTVPGTPFYRNDIDLTDVIFYGAGTGIMVSDDLALAAGSCEEIAYYEIAVIGEGASGSTFDVHTELWTYEEVGDCWLGVKIANSDGDFAAVPNDGETVSLLGVTLPAGVHVPTNNIVWLTATFTADDAGWILAERAEVGFTQNLFAEGTRSPCLYVFTGGYYAGFYATLNCQTTGDPLGACCNASVCSETIESACSVGGGTWQGAFTTCDPSPCLPGACCSGVDFTTCTETVESGCVGDDELFHPEVACADNTCKPAFPGYVNDFVTGGFGVPEPGFTWADDLLFGPCDLSAYSVGVVGESGFPDFDVHLEIWTNNDHDTASDPLDDTPMALISGTEADFIGIRSDQMAHTLLAGPFPKIALPEKVWLVFTTSLPRESGPLLGGEAEPGLSQDWAARSVNPTDPDAWGFFNYGGFNPEGCPGPLPCRPAGSFHITVWCQGEPPIGACCNDVAGTCVDGVPESQCDGRFAPDTTCDAGPFNPSCGTSACCSEYTCINFLPDECVIFGESFETPVAIGYGRLCEEVDCPHLACLEATGDCSVPHSGPGCDDAFCCGTVCSADSQCCEPDPGWDVACASLAATMCEQTLENDHCRDPEPIEGIGTYLFDTSLATTDGAPHEGCLDQLGEEGHITDDAWFCWTSPCNGNVSVSTCDGGATFDTKLAVYDGCGACPPTDADLIACNDDACLGQRTDSTVVLNAAVGEEKLIRIGMFPGEQAGGAGELIINCGVPGNLACRPGVGDCCTPDASVACDDQGCCEKVCACDPSCCSDGWDEFCTGTGREGTGCGAAVLCDQCRLPGDINGDGRVGLVDTGTFINTCMNGPAVVNSNPLCEAADFDMNGTGDLKDFAGLQEVFNP